MDRSRLLIVLTLGLMALSIVLARLERVGYTKQLLVGTVRTIVQLLAIGFVLTVATIWLVPVIRDNAGWAWAFVLLVPGPIIGVIAMLRLRRLPEAQLIAGGRR